MADDRHADAAAVPVPDAGDDTLRAGLAWAMRGTVDGDLIDPDSEIPIGEAERLAYEFVRDHVAAAVQAERERVDRYQRFGVIHIQDQLRMIRAIGEALGIDQNDADACVPGCDEGAGGLGHDLHHLIERDAERGAAIERARVVWADLQEEYRKREQSQNRIRDRLGSELAAVRAQNRVLHERLNRVRRLCTLTLDSMRIHAREMAEDVLRLLDGTEATP